MRIRFKLFASLADYLPPGSRDNQVDIDIDPTDTVAAIIDRFHLPEPLVHLVLVNGVYLAPGARASRCLEDGDQLALWPPIAGG